MFVIFVTSCDWQLDNKHFIIIIIIIIATNDDSGCSPQTDSINYLNVLA